VVGLKIFVDEKLLLRLGNFMKSLSKLEKLDIKCKNKVFVTWALP
jgi:hypothetical protein